MPGGQQAAILALESSCKKGVNSGGQTFGTVLSFEKSTTLGETDCAELETFDLELKEDSYGIVLLNEWLEKGKDHLSALYSYRSCIRAMPRMAASDKEELAELYKTTYSLMDKEISVMRGVHEYQLACCSAWSEDLQMYLGPDAVNGPSTTHIWSLLRVLDVLLLLDHIKDRKTSLANDFSWYKRAFSQVSLGWEDADDMRLSNDQLQAFLNTRWAILTTLKASVAALPNGGQAILTVVLGFCLDTLDLGSRVPAFWDRHTILRTLPCLLLLATPTESAAEALFRNKRTRLDRFHKAFKSEPVVPGFMDAFVSPMCVLRDLSPTMQDWDLAERFSLPPPQDLGGQELLAAQKHYEIIYEVERIEAYHDSFAVRFSAAVNELRLQREADSARVVAKNVATHIYELVLEGFRLVSDWTGAVLEQAAWKAVRPAKTATSPPLQEDGVEEPSEYDKAVRLNYSASDKAALAEVVSCIKDLGQMLLRAEALVLPVVHQAIHLEVQEFVQNAMVPLLRHSVTKRLGKNGSCLSSLRTIAADWKGNVVLDANATPMRSAKERPHEIYMRPTPPSTSQIHAMQYLVSEVVVVGSSSRSGSLFATDRVLKLDALEALRAFQESLLCFPLLIDYRTTLLQLTNIGALWFREYFIELAQVVQFPISCSLPWILANHALESDDAGTLDSVLLLFDMYNDAADVALHMLRRQFLFDEIEAEVDLCFEQLVFKLSEKIFTHSKCLASSQLMDPLFAANGGQEKWRPQTRHVASFFQERTLSLLGRSIDLKKALTLRLNAMLRENLELLFSRFEAQGLFATTELRQLLQILELTQQLLAEHTAMDPFSVVLAEVLGSVPFASFSGRMVAQVLQDVRHDLLPSAVFCTTTQRFIHSIKASGPPPISRKPSMPHARPHLLYGSQELNWAYSFATELKSQFFGLEHVQALLQLLLGHGNSTSLPRLIQAFLDSLESQVGGELAPHVAELRGVLPSRPPLDPTLSSQAFVEGIQELLGGVYEYPDLGECVQALKELGGILILLSLMDTALREQEMELLMVTSPFLGMRGAFAAMVPPLSSSSSLSEAGARGRRRSRRLGEEGEEAEEEEEGEEAGELVSPMMVELLGMAKAMELSSNINNNINNINNNNNNNNRPAVAASSSSSASTPSPKALAKVAQRAVAVTRGGLSSGRLLSAGLSRLRTALAPFRASWAPTPSSSRSSRTDDSSSSSSREQRSSNAHDQRTDVPFHLVYSALQFVICSGPLKPGLEDNWEHLGDAVAWGGAAVLLLLGQRHMFEGSDLCGQALLRAELEASTAAAAVMTQARAGGAGGGGATGDKARKALEQAHGQQQKEVRLFLDNAKRVRRLNKFLFSLLGGTLEAQEQAASLVQVEQVEVDLGMEPPVVLEHIQLTEMKRRFSMRTAAGGGQSGSSISRDGSEKEGGERWQQQQQERQRRW